MKQILALAMTLLLLCGSALAAEIGSSLKVVDCNEYISLREEPSKSAGVLAKIPLKARVAMVDEASDGFWKVSYQGKEGYALSGYLREVDDYSGDPVDVDDELRYNINLFLSNFTEVGFTRNAGSYDESYVDKMLLTKFGINHCWFNRQNQIESGEYFNYNNMRLPRGRSRPSSGSTSVWTSRRPIPLIPSITGRAITTGRRPAGIPATALPARPGSRSWAVAATASGSTSTAR